MTDYNVQSINRLQVRDEEDLNSESARKKLASISRSELADTKVLKENKNTLNKNSNKQTKKKVNSKKLTSIMN